MLGAGGTLADVLDDRTFRLAPLTNEHADAMIGDFASPGCWTVTAAARPCSRRRSVTSSSGSRRSSTTGPRSSNSISTRSSAPTTGSSSSTPESASARRRPSAIRCCGSCAGQQRQLAESRMTADVAARDPVFAGALHVRCDQAAQGGLRPRCRSLHPWGGGESAPCQAPARHEAGSRGVDRSASSCVTARGSAPPRPTGSAGSLRTRAG